MSSPPSLPAYRPESLGMLVGQVRSELVRAFERELAVEGMDLRFMQFLALKRLATCGPMSAGELARSLDHDAGAMTRLLDQLEGKGYVQRQPHAQDRRALRILLTPAGHRLWERAAHAHGQLLERAQRDLELEERAQMLDYLGRVLNALRHPD